LRGAAQLKRKTLGGATANIMALKNDSLYHYLRNLDMLPLDDDRWEQLTTFFEKPEDLPKTLAIWLASIGSEQEGTIYREDLLDLFLHQVTITNAAFAVVPWLVDVTHQHIVEKSHGLTG
jgi:hypothetical protein